MNYLYKSKEISRSHHRLFFIVFIGVIFFWGFIASQARYYLGIDESLLGYLKYFIILVYIAYIISNCDGFRKSGAQVLVAIYLLYILIHVVGDNNIKLIIDGLRYEVLPVVFGLFFIRYLERRKVAYVFILQILLIVCLLNLLVALAEYLNRDIIEVLYRRALEDMPHVYWFTAPRLISLSENPIILGFNVCLTIALLNMINLGRKNALFFFLIMLACLFVSAMTLSRASFLVASVLCVGAIFLRGSTSIKITAFVMIIMTSIYVISWLYENSPYSVMRFANIFDVDEYAGNIRLSNWVSAYSNMNYWEIIWGRGLGSTSSSLDDAEIYGSMIVESSYVSHLVNFGLIGFTLYVLILFSYASNIFRNMRNHTKLFSVHASFLFLFLVFSVGNDTHRNMPFTYVFWLMFSISFIVNAGAVSKNARS